MRRLEPAVARLLILLGALTVVVLLLVFLGDVLLPLILGLAIAYLLDPAVSWLARHGVSRPWGAALIALGLALVVALALVFLLPILVDETQDLIARLPEYHAAITARVAPVLEEIAARYPAQYADAQARMRAAIQENWPSLATRAAAWLGGLFADVLGLVLLLVSLVFVPVFAFYLLVDWPKLRTGLDELVPRPYREVARSRVAEVNVALGSFLRGQLTIALILATINGTGLLLLGVPFGLGIGLVAGLANLVPYMALVVGLLPALLFCWAEHQSWWLLLGVAAVFTGAQLLEGTVLSPRILSLSVKLHPVIVLLAVILGGSLFGFLGMMVAVPGAAVLQVFARHWVAQYKSSLAYRGEPDGPASEPGAGA